MDLFANNNLVHQNEPLYFHNQPQDNHYNNTNNYINTNQNNRIYQYNSHQSSDVVMPNVFVTIPLQPTIRNTNMNRSQQQSTNEIKSEPIKVEVSESNSNKLAPNALLNSTVDTTVLTLNVNNKSTEDLTIQNHKKSIVCHKCEKCPFISISQLALNTHIEKNHNETIEEHLSKKLSCPGCANIFYSKKSLETHLLNDHQMNQIEIETLVNSLIEDDESENSSDNENDDDNDNDDDSDVVITNSPSSSTSNRKSRIYIKNVKILQKPNLINSDLLVGRNFTNNNINNNNNTISNLKENNIFHTNLVDHRKSKIFLKNVNNLKDPTASIENSTGDEDLQQQQQNRPKSKIYIKNVDILKNPIYLDGLQNNNHHIPMTNDLFNDPQQQHYNFNQNQHHHNDYSATGNELQELANLAAGNVSDTYPIDLNSNSNSTDKGFIENDSNTNRMHHDNSLNGLYQRPMDFFTNLSSIEMINEIQIESPNNISTSSSPSINFTVETPQSNDEVVILNEYTVIPDDLVETTAQLAESLDRYHHHSIQSSENFTNINDFNQHFHHTMKENDNFLMLDSGNTINQQHQHLNNDEQKITEINHLESNYCLTEIGQNGLINHNNIIINNHHSMCDNHENINNTNNNSNNNCNNDKQNEDILFVCAEEIINENNSDGNSNNINNRTLNFNVDVEENNPNELLISENTFGSNHSDGIVDYVSGNNDRLENLDNEIKKNNRGRPKGAKQTGVTQLKKVCTNLTPKEIGYKCSINGCAMRFRSKDILNYHERCHSKNSAIEMICPECNSNEFRLWNTLHTHLWRQHQIDMELFSCKLCNFKTPILSRLNNTHIKIHSSERNFKCDHCGKGFKNTKQLKNHRRVHRQNDEIFKECPKCPAKFNKLNAFKIHIEKIHKEKKEFKCPECDRVSFSKSGLKMHLLTHSSEKKFKCDYEKCCYETHDHNAFRRHKMKHEDIKHYKCPYCSYTSIQSTTFRNHILKNHSAKATELIFQCKLCPFVTINKSKYDFHVTKHDLELQNLQSAEIVLVTTPATTSAITQSAATPITTTVNNNIILETYTTVDLFLENNFDQQAKQQNNKNNNNHPHHNTHHPSILHNDHSNNIIMNNSTDHNIILETEQLISSATSLEQQPLIRPALFANNFSNIENLRFERLIHNSESEFFPNTNLSNSNNRNDENDKRLDDTVNFFNIDLT